MATPITYQDKQTGDSVPASEFNQIKAAVNGNISDTETAQETADNAISQLANKVDKSGTDRLITQTEATKLANLSEHFVGRYASLNALNTAKPTGVDGQYAVVDASGSDAVEYIWDSTDNKWVQGSPGKVTSVNSKTGAVSLVIADIPNLQAELDSKTGNIIAVSRTGGVVQFDRNTEYNSKAQPYSGQITFDTTTVGAVVNAVAWFYFSGSDLVGSLPAIASANIINLGAFIPGATNLLRLQYKSSTEVVVVIFSSNQTAIAGSTQRKRFNQNYANPSATTTPIQGSPTTTLKSNSTYHFKLFVRYGCSGTGGGQFGFQYPSDAFLDAGGITPTTATTAFTSLVFITSTTAPGAVTGTVGGSRASANHYMTIEGDITTVTGGDFYLIFKAATAGQIVTIYSTSILELYEVSAV